LRSSAHFQGVLELSEPSDIAAGSRETVDVTITDRVQALCHDDRHRATGLLQCLGGRTNPGQDDLRAERNQLRRVFAQARGIAHAPAIIDPHIAPDGPAQFLEALHERGEAGLRLRLVRGRIHEHADAPHPLLLRVRRERPSCRRAADERDEVAASHSITSSARASKLSGTVRPSALAVLSLIARFAGPRLSRNVVIVQARQAWR
jgi:hypothetical protein